MTKRNASHAGSWYTNDGSKLARQLDEWLNQVDLEGTTPVEGARVIIAPHAGYAYSGPAAAWAYKCLDVSKATSQRVFLLGPSHHLYLSNCALPPPAHTHYSTPLGDLPLDKETIKALRSTGEFRDLTATQDSAEHSLEMHLPYMYHILSRSFGKKLPLLIPIVIGSTSASTESKFGRLLAPYLADPCNVFIISSDFCHWGARFQYTYYLPSSSISTVTIISDSAATKAGSPSNIDLSSGIHLMPHSTPHYPPIHTSITVLDKSAMAAIETGSHESFLQNLKKTGNTVCGRHPIGVVMAAMESIAEGASESAEQSSRNGKFKFIRYERSSEVQDAADSSVSYASAYAVI